MVVSIPTCLMLTSTWGIPIPMGFLFACVVLVVVGGVSATRTDWVASLGTTLAQGNVSDIFGTPFVEEVVAV